MDRRKSLQAAAGALGLSALFAATLARAQPGAWPSRPVRLVVPFAPGAGTDIFARYFARKLGELTSQAFIVENKPGANGFIGVKAVTSATPDGYTLFFGSNSTLATNVALFRNLPYDPLLDLVPISMVMRSPVMLIAPGLGRHDSLRALVDAARASPGALQYGSGSAGYQLMGELFLERAGIRMLNIPYKGAPETVAAVLAGEVEMGVCDVPAAMALIKGGKVRALAVGSDTRLPGLPDVPTAAEAGIAGFTANTWIAAAAPRGTPEAVVRQLDAQFRQILAMPETATFFAGLNVEPFRGGQSEMVAYQRQEILGWKRVAQIAGIELQ